MVTGLLGPQLLGRQREREVLERLLDDARARHGGALVLYGDPGTGKTALLDLAVELGDDFKVVRAAGVEGETELPYAALQQLSAPIFDRSAHLPDPQREALSVAFGLTAGPAPNPFLVGLAVLGLLSEAAEDQPLLCVVDDAQWLDRASARALAFIARRLLAEKIALLFAARERGGALGGFAEVHVGPLGRRVARTLLESVLPTRVDDRVVERIVAETHGNPLALLELPRGMTPSQLAGGFGLPAAVPLSARIEEHFMRRAANVPPDAWRLLLLAAADPTGDLALVSRAAEGLGIHESAARALESEGLLDLRSGVVFRHPLARSAVYRAATVDEQSAVHRALADATDSETDPDRRAWHRAQATSMPDEDVAAELERSAARAQARGGFAAAAAFLERSSVLTLDPARRVGRELAAAQAKYEAGAFDEAITLAANAAAGPLDGVQRAELDLLRARISFAEERGNEAPRLLLTAAQDFEPFDARRAREVYLEALSAASGGGVAEVRTARTGSVRGTARTPRSVHPNTASKPRATSGADRSGGERRAAERGDAPLAIAASGLALSPDGATLFVTGTSPRAVTPPIAEACISPRRVWRHDRTVVYRREGMSSLDERLARVWNPLHPPLRLATAPEVDSSSHGEGPMLGPPHRECAPRVRLSGEIWREAEWPARETLPPKSGSRCGGPWSERSCLLPCPTGGRSPHPPSWWR